MRECSKCGKIKPVFEFYRNPARRDGLSNHCKPCQRAYERMRHRTWYKEPHRKAQRRYHRKLKEEAIKAYGGKCQCCGESHFEFLTIHVIGGGGTKYRMRGRFQMSSLVKKLGYPKRKFKLLCANCNSSIGLYGYCPHKK